MEFFKNWIKYYIVCFHSLGMVLRFKPCQILTIKGDKFYKLEFVSCTCKHTFPEFKKISSIEGQQGGSFGLD